jgi:hypothetical protein
MEVANHPFNLVENAWSLKKIMLRDKLIMVYSDHITEKSFEYLMHLAEDKLTHFKTDIKNKKKILHILVESLQNIAQHGYKDSSDTVASLFVIGLDDENRFFVLAGNTVTHKSEEFLREKLDHLNSLNPDELRLLYKHSIQHNDFTAKGGAGLGFIDIMRKSQSKLQYHFEPVNKGHSFFTFKVNINPKSE